MIELRQADERDVEATTRFLAGLSPDVSWLRFASGIGCPPGHLVQALLRRDDSHGAWIAVRDGQVVAHASWVILRDGITAELAAVVGDGWRRTGLGRLLGRLATDDAAAHGAEALRLEVLPGNLAARSLVLHLWPHAAGEDHGGLVVYDVPLHRTADVR